MEEHIFKMHGKDLVILKVAGNLFLEGFEGKDLQVQGNPRDLKIMNDDDAQRVTAYGNLTIKVPQTVRTRVEKVGGNAIIRGVMSDNFYVQRVGGNVSVQDVKAIEVSRVGGSCHVKKVLGNTLIERVSGEVFLLDAGGTVTVNSARSDVTLLLVRDSALASASGNVIMQYAEDEIKPITIRAKGDINLFLPPNPNARVDATFSGWDIMMTMQGKTSNLGGGSYVGDLGNGGAEIKLAASGNILISDESLGDLRAETPDGAFVFNLDSINTLADEDQADAYQRRVQRAMEKVALKMEKLNDRLSETNRRVAERQDEIARRIEERARQRAERIGKMVEVRIGKRAHAEAAEALEQVKEQLKNLELPIDIPALDFLRDIEIPAVPPIPPVPSAESSRASARREFPGKPDSQHEERMMVLQMLKDGTITVEQAEKLIAAMKNT